MNWDFISSTCLLDVLPLTAVFSSLFLVCLSSFLSASLLSFKWHFLWKKHLQWSFVGDERACHRCLSPLWFRECIFSSGLRIIGSQLTMQWGLKCNFHSSSLSGALPFRPRWPQPWGLSLARCSGLAQEHFQNSKAVPNLDLEGQVSKQHGLHVLILARPLGSSFYQRFMNSQSYCISRGLYKCPSF